MAPSLTKILSALSHEEQLELEKYATFLMLRRKMSAEQLLTDDISSAELTKLAAAGGGFEWLANEPDIYNEFDGESVTWPQKP
ncbi:MAG: hypothetical protein ACREOO_07070 [bacterium]